jgi:hypothetical protein
VFSLAFEKNCISRHNTFAIFVLVTLETFHDERFERVLVQEILQVLHHEVHYFIVIGLQIHMDEMVDISTLMCNTDVLFTSQADSLRLVIKCIILLKKKKKKVFDSYNSVV